MSRPLEVELEIGMHVFATEGTKDAKDSKEGPRAFAEKRAPKFVGR